MENETERARGLHVEKYRYLVCFTAGVKHFWVVDHSVIWYAPLITILCLPLFDIAKHSKKREQASHTQFRVGICEIWKKN